MFTPGTKISEARQITPTTVGLGTVLTDKDGDVWMVYSFYDQMGIALASFEIQVMSSECVLRKYGPLTVQWHPSAADQLVELEDEKETITGTEITLARNARLRAQVQRLGAENEVLRRDNEKMRHTLSAVAENIQDITSDIEAAL